MSEWDYPEAPTRVLIFNGDLPTPDDPLPKFLSDPDAANLMRAADQDPVRRLVVEMLARTGLRVGEFCELTADAVVFMNGRHWLRVPIGKLHNECGQPELEALLQDLNEQRPDVLARDAAQNVARKVKAPKAVPKQRRTIIPAQTRQLIAERDPRFAAAAALCFVQGWRISEALGLAWQDLDLDQGSALVRRRSTYADRVGMVLGPTKTRGATGVQVLGRTVVSLRRARRDLHEADRAAYPGPWPTVEYDGEQLDLVFTTADGTSTLRRNPHPADPRRSSPTDVSAVNPSVTSPNCASCADLTT
ncbi:tyrosine-type recombinase/integrase [Ilumatobacter sp.]|uniref:tyrosine-type recombinase/integrase n=1 Tax=Ilumatobacter sp. TaxID=1967498 RepID=UPI003C41EDAC